jgi:putative transposase
MPRQARLDLPGLVHHVMARGIEGREIFKDNKDRELFLKRLADIFSDSGAPTLYAWALIPNHFHLLIRPAVTHLSTVMQRLMTGYAVNFNRQNNRKGHLFQNRYKSIVVEEDSYFLELIRYIHLNPVRAGLVSSVEQLADYPFAGHAVIMGKRKYPIQNIDDVLAMFSTKRSEAIGRYQEFVAEGIGHGTRKDLQGGGLIRSSGGITALLARNSEEHEAADDRILGSGEFVEMVLNTHKKEHDFHMSNVEDVLQNVATMSGLSREQIVGLGRNRDVSKARREFYRRAQEEAGASMALLGRMTGRAHTSVARAIQQAKREGERNVKGQQGA